MQTWSAFVYTEIIKQNQVVYITSVGQDTQECMSTHKACFVSHWLARTQNSTRGGKGRNELAEVTRLCARLAVWVFQLEPTFYFLLIKYLGNLYSHCDSDPYYDGITDK